MKKSDSHKKMFEQGLAFNPRWIEKTKGNKNPWWEDGLVEEIDKNPNDSKIMLTNKQRSFELGFLEELPVSQMSFLDKKDPKKRQIKAKYLGCAINDSDVVWADDFFKSFTETRTEDYDAVVTNCFITATSFYSCEIILAFRGEFHNLYFVKYHQQADTLAELYNQINEDFDCWDEYDTEHNLDDLLGVKYCIKVDKDNSKRPLWINGRVKKEKK